MMMWLSLTAIVLAAVGVGLAIWSLYDRRRRTAQKLRTEYEQATETSRKAEEDTERALRRLPNGGEKG